MKILILISLISFGLSQNLVTEKNLVLYGDNYFKENDDKPFNGTVFSLLPESGMKILEYQMLNGQKNGSYKEWYDNGKIKIKMKYLNNLKNGSITMWNYEGVKVVEGNYKSDIEDGLWSIWYDDGTKQSKGYFEMGSKIGTWIYRSDDKGIEYIGKIYNGEIDSAKNDGDFLVFENDSPHPLKYFSINNGKKDGIFMEWNSWGDIKTKGRYIDGAKDSIWIEWHDYDNDKKKFHGNYKNGKREGLHTEWNYYGGKLREANYSNDRIEGIRTIWYDDYYEQKKQEGNYSNGRVNGLITVWFKNGKKGIESNYKNGKQDGTYTKWFENGNLRVQGNYKNDIKEGLWTNWWNSYDEKFSEGIYVNGEKDGEWIYWENPYYNGSNYEFTIKIETYDNGNILESYNTLKLTKEYFNSGKKKLIGYYYKKNRKRNTKQVREYKWTWWYETGEKRKEAHYKNGDLHGRYTEWYKNKYKIKEGFYKSGEKHGLFTEWDTNGEKISGIVFVNGRNKEDKLLGEYNNYDENGNRDGQWIEWYENGSRKYSKYYNNGIKNGKWIEWHDNGKKKKELEYLNGTIVGKYYLWSITGLNNIEIIYDDNGAVISRTTFDLNFDENHKEYKTSVPVIEPIKTERFFEDHVIYFDNKIKKEKGRYKIMEGGNKVKDGKWIEWYENGNKKTEENYKEEWGLPYKRGKWISWHQNGVKKTEGYFVKNLEQGIFKKWNSEGALISETPYKDGVPIHDDKKKILDKELNKYNGDYENGLIISKKENPPVLNGSNDKKMVEDLKKLNEEKERIKINKQNELFNSKTKKRVVYSSSDFKTTSLMNYKYGTLIAIFEIENFTNKNYRSVYFMINGLYVKNGNEFKKRIRFEDLNKQSKSKVEVDLDSEILLLDCKFLKSIETK